MTDAPTILIVDDHPLFRDALKLALEAAYPSDADTYQCGSLAEAVEQIKAARFDLILLDLNLGDVSGFDGLNTLLGRTPDTPIAVVSATENAEAFAKARALGARGYIPKSMTNEDLSAALATLLDGGAWFPEASDEDGEPEGEELATRVASLTPAQRRVLQGLADGLLNKQIAYEMNISVATVKAHMTAIFRKLGATNRTQALLLYKSALSI